MASITIKTPKRSISKGDHKSVKEFFRKELETKAARVTLGILSQNIEKAYEDQIAVLATMFQRMVARTPLDENYDRVIVQEDGAATIIHHTPDDEICREHWYIEESHFKQRIYSKQFLDGSESYMIVNDGGEIKAIREKLMAMFPFSEFAKLGVEPNFSIVNDCKHFARIEFGYDEWKNDSQPVIGNDVGLEHGVQNRHSVQAPVGMERITRAEFEAIRQKKSVRSLRSRYKGGFRMKVTPSDAKLEEFLKILKRSHRVRYGDIKRFLEVY